VAQTVDEVTYLAQAYLSVGQADRAADLVERALADDPDDVGLLLTLSKARSAQGLRTEALELARAAVAVDADSTDARLVLSDAALKTDDGALAAEQAGVVLAQHPENPTALLLLAASGADDRSATGRRLTRERYRRALSSGDEPWMVATAARLEAHVGQVSEARRLVDAGLERHPTDERLLRVRLDLQPDPTEESFAAVADLLAASPTDPGLRFRYLALVAQRRRRHLTALWAAPVAAALGLTVLGGPWRFVWVGLVLLLGLGTVLGAVRAAQSVPAPMHEQLALRRPWDTVDRAVLRIGSSAVVVGSLLLAGGVPTGAVLLVLATLCWAVARAAQRHRERRSAREVDDDVRASQAQPRGAAAAAEGGAAHETVGPATVSVAGGRRLQALVTPVLLLPVAAASLLPATTPEDLAARATLGIVAAVVALAAVAESVGWGRLPTVRRVAAVQRTVVAVLAVAALLLLVPSTDRLGQASAEWVRENPSTRDRGPGDQSPVTVPPGRLTPTPAPSISVTVPDLSGLTDLDLGAGDGDG